MSESMSFDRRRQHQEDMEDGVIELVFLLMATRSER
jgi:hypothetical protein